MRVKEIIFEKLKVLCVEEPSGITASDLAAICQMRRNLVSQYLNELVRDGRVVKENTRPVYFRLPEVGECRRVDETQRDVFFKFIGANGSLKQEIDQCRSAVQYPNKGLPILLNGGSGVGKSFLAELIYEYAVEEGVIANDAPFVTLNCADYANNPELLSAMLFGYTKGAFTGADQNSAGLIEQADQGYLFLDEVHRLSSESQEKLFLLMDKDEYRRMGETKGSRKAQVRLIFATTEDPNEVLIHTLRRRIPMIIHIPSLQHRPMKEKLELLQFFFHKESRIFHKKIFISAQAVNLLLSFQAEGNIGSLENIIRYSCAYAHRATGNADYLYVDIQAFPVESKLQQVEMKEYVREDILIDGELDYERQESYHSTQDGLENLLHIFQENYKEKRREFTDTSLLQKAVYQVFETLQGKESNAIHTHLVAVVVDKFEKENGVHLTLNSANIISGVLEAYQDRKDECDKASFQQALKQLEGYYFKMFSLTEKLIIMLETTLGIQMKTSVQFYIALFIMLSTQSSRAKRYNALIMAHGNSTASSIASTANEMLGEFIFEAFDMPVHTSFELFATLLKKYLDRINKNYPTIILVDMGSLLEIDRHMEVDEYQEIGILDQLSTSLALEVGNRLRQGEHLSLFLPDLCTQMKMHYRYIQPQKRKKAILCVCISGVGTAEKIREIIRDFVQDDTDLLTYDYMRVLQEGKNCPVFKEYDVQCLVGTSDLKIEGVHCININHLMDNEDERDIRLFMEKVVCEDEDTNIDAVQQKIIKAFSLENLINRLVFLNPQTIIDDVEKMIFDTELTLHMKFDTDTRMMLFLHVAVLIERALLKNCEEDIYQNAQWLQEHEEDLHIIAVSFQSIEQKFNIQIPQAEIVTILSMILMKQ